MLFNELSALLGIFGLHLAVAISHLCTSPFAQIDIGFGNALCARITYVGELGYELFVPVE